MLDMPSRASSPLWLGSFRCATACLPRAERVSSAPGVLWRLDATSCLLFYLAHGAAECPAGRNLRYHSTNQRRNGLRRLTMGVWSGGRTAFLPLRATDYAAV